MSRTAFVILSFEGPDSYCAAGGLASRVSGLSTTLADMGFETHLFFVGDPKLPGHEIDKGGMLHLHRWCQWISHYHPAGVYDGEEGKVLDWSHSLPRWLVDELIVPKIKESKTVFVLGEEWHATGPLITLHDMLSSRSLSDVVHLFWNANNTFGFHRIDWNRLAQAAVITTVSRYMRHRMWSLGVDPLVIPNGLPADALRAPGRHAVAAFRRRVQGRTVLGKVARWDPDKRWLLAMDTVAELKRHGKRPLLIARGGMEAHRHEVMAKAAGNGLRITERGNGSLDAQGLLRSLDGVQAFDVVCLKSHLGPSARRLLFRGADAILANSGHEPFGLVGLEAMAVSGLACTGGTGEDYVVPGWNALVLQSTDPKEFLTLYEPLKTRPSRLRAIRRHARYTACQNVWQAIIERNLLPRIALSNSDHEKPNLGHQRQKGQTHGHSNPHETRRDNQSSAWAFSRDHIGRVGHGGPIGRNVLSVGSEEVPR
jgi:glycosyltransferase involved in cell wall biosynthesis